MRNRPRSERSFWFLVLAIALAALLWAPEAQAAPADAVPIPTIKIGIGESRDPGEISVGLQILFLLTVLSLAPSILIMMTSFTRLVVVFSFLRHALGTQTMPPNQVMIGLALFLTFFVMTPTYQAVYEKAWVPYKEKKITQAQAVDEALKPIRQFMFKQTREKDLALFIGMAKMPKPKTMEDVPTTVLLPSFMISELKTAFQIGFILYVPFLVIDIVVASVLLSMGMMMMPPMMISLPMKLLLFVLVDGWNLVVGSLVKSFA